MAELTDIEVGPRRGTPVQRRRRAGWRCWPLAVLAGLGGCAAVPENTVSERLDERTGTTVTTMQKPIELVATEPRGANSDPFAYVAPFETNRMGQRQLYLWIAVPDERGGAAPPELRVGGMPLAARPLGGAAQAVGLGAFPYATPAPWSAVQVFSIEAAALDTLATASSLDVSVRYADGRVIHFGGTPQPADIVQQFRRSLGL